MAEIRYTRRPEGPPLSSARSLSGPVWAAALLPDQLRGELPQQAVAAHAGLPIQQVREAVSRGVPLVLARANSASAAREAARPALRDAGLTEHALTLMEPDAGAATGALMAVIAGAVAVMGVLVLAVGASVLAGAGLLATLVGALLIAVAAAVSVIGVRRGARQRAERERFREANEASQPPASLPEAWVDLVALRREILRTELPSAARADLWAAADALERPLLAGANPEPIVAALAQAKATLAGHQNVSAPGTHDAIAQLQRTSDAATRALQEVHRASRGSTSS